MKGIGLRLYCFIAFLLTVGLTATAATTDLKDGELIPVIIKEDEGSRSGDVSQNEETTEIVEDVKVNDLPLTPNDTAPRQNEYEYSPLESTAKNNLAHAYRGNSARSGQTYSRPIPPNRYLHLHGIPGGYHMVSCSREGEFHNLWLVNQCLVCACIREQRVLRPICVSCAGCVASRPSVDVDIPDIPGIPITPETPIIPVVPGIPIEHGVPLIPDTPVVPIVPGKPDTNIVPIEEEVTCRPLPSGQPFDNPLHPCQVCICIETIDVYGKADVNIKCQENPQCVLPTDNNVIPTIPDVPVPSPYCDKFPLNVLFPHPSDSCKTCRCSVQISQLGTYERLITCLPNPDCITNTPVPQIITEPPPYSVTPVYPIPPVNPESEPVPISPEPIPSIDIITPEPPPWTPAPAPPAPPGPLPGPSPHKSCRPYVPNQPFQHPWDECQMCLCTEAYAQGQITIEINCFTKKSCCVEPPFDVITPATLPPAPHQQVGKIKILDAVCEFKPFGVEFVHPKDPCQVCTCELQGLSITSLCQRSSNPECLQSLIAYPTVTPTLDEIMQGSSSLVVPGSINAASLSQNNAIKNAYLSYLNPHGPTGQASSPSPSLADQQAGYNQWSLQNSQRPADLSILSQLNQIQHKIPGYLDQSLQKPGVALTLPQPTVSLNYEPGYYGIQTGYPQWIQGPTRYHTIPSAYPQNYPGYYNQGQYTGYPGYVRPKEVISQSQGKATASSSAAASTFQGYLPTYQTYTGYSQGLPASTGNGVQQFSQSISSAQSSAETSLMAAAKYKGRSGKPDDAESAIKED